MTPKKNTMKIANVLCVKNLSHVKNLVQRLHAQKHAAMFIGLLKTSIINL